MLFRSKVDIELGVGIIPLYAAIFFADITEFCADFLPIGVGKIYIKKSGVAVERFVYYGLYKGRIAQLKGGNDNMEPVLFYPVFTKILMDIILIFHINFLKIQVELKMIVSVVNMRVRNVSQQCAYAFFVFLQMAFIQQIPKPSSAIRVKKKNRAGNGV